MKNNGDAICCPGKWAYHKGLCSSCYQKDYREKVRLALIANEERKQQRKNYKIPDLMIEDFQLYNYNKLPRLITV